jgi:hypothetical protein
MVDIETSDMDEEQKSIAAVTDSRSRPHPWTRRSARVARLLIQVCVGAGTSPAYSVGRWKCVGGDVPARAE